MKNYFYANKEFTDRDDFREILINSVETPQRFDEFRVKIFYGAGGQGKSGLRDDFFVMKYLLPEVEKNKNLIFVEPIDFENDPTIQRMDEALLKIASQLIEKGNIPLPAFCLGFIKYKQKKSAEQNIQTTYPFLFKLITKHKVTGNDKANQAAEKLATEAFNEVVNVGLELFSESLKSIPLVSFFTEKAVKKGKAKLIEWIRSSEVKNILGDIDTLSETKLFERLPKLLSYDINKYLEGVSDENGIPNKRLVTIFDGYERLWASEINRSIDKDKWIREFIHETPGLLFVIFGRDKLNWSEKDKVWNNILDQHLMQGLSDKDADIFLQKIPIVEEDIRKVIVETSKSRNPHEGCLPFLLNMQVNTYVNIINNNSPLISENFAGDGEQVIEHFFEHIPKQTAYAIKVLCNLMFVNEPIINYLVKQQFFAAGIISMKELATFSFINIEAGQATIHGLMRDITSKQYRLEQPEEWLRLHEVMFDYYDNQIAFSEYTIISSSIGLNLEYSSYYKYRYDFTHYGEWLINRTRMLFGNDKLNSITNTLLSAINIPSFLEDKLLYGKLCFRLYEQFDSKSEEKAKEYYLMLCSNCFAELLPIQLDKNSIDQLELSNEQEHILFWRFSSIMAEANHLQEQNKLQESFDKWQIVFNIADKFNFGYDEINYSKILIKLGYFAKSEPILYNRFIEAKDIPYKASYANQLMKLFLKMGRYEEALFYFQIAFDYYSTIEDEPTWTGIMYLSLADILIESGQNLTKAEQLLADAYNIFQLYLPELHPNFSDYFTTLSKLNFANKKYELVIDTVNEGFQINQKIYSEGNEQSLLQGSLYAKACDMLLLAEDGEIIVGMSKVEFEKSNLYLMKANANARDILGYHNPILHESVKWIIKYFERINQKNDAIFYENTLKEYQRIITLNSNVRTQFYKKKALSVDEQSKIIDRCKTITSLPTNSTNLIITSYILPFFKTYNLYCISFEGLHLPYKKYFLANGDKIFLLDTTNQNIYKVAAEELVLTKTNLVYWLIFFFDNVIGKHGKFYLINTIEDIPFRLDIDIPKKLKEKIINKIEPIKILTIDKDNFVLESKIVFQENLFYSKIKVNRKNGEINLFEEAILSLESSDVTNDESLPISVDPIYKKIQKNWWKKENLTIEELVYGLLEWSFNNYINSSDLQKIANDPYWLLKNEGTIPIQDTKTVCKKILEEINKLEPAKDGFLEKMFNKIGDASSFLINYLEQYDSKFTHLQIRNIVQN